MYIKKISNKKIKLIANSLFWYIWTQARVASSLPMAVILFLTANLSYNSFVSLPLEYRWFELWSLYYHTGCTSWFFCGWSVPNLLAILLNGGLAAKYGSSPLPQMGKSSVTVVSKPVFRKMLFPTLLQTTFAAYLGSIIYNINSS
jgi:transmembrane protein 126A